MASWANDENLGNLIAFGLPGFAGLFALSFFLPTVKGWFEVAESAETTVGGFLFIAFASLTVGLFLNGARAVAVDWLMQFFVRRRTKLDLGTLGYDKRLRYQQINNLWWRFYQFYANSLLAAPLVFATLWYFEVNAASLETRAVVVSDPSHLWKAMIGSALLLLGASVYAWERCYRAMDALAKAEAPKEPNPYINIRKYLRMAWKEIGEQIEKHIEKAWTTAVRKTKSLFRRSDEKKNDVDDQPAGKPSQPNT